MVRNIRQLSAWWGVPISVGVYLLALFAFVQPVSAINQIPTPEPQPGAYGLAATKTQAAPTVGATITTPGNGGSYANSPITVSGICPTDLLVQIYDNGVMAGSVMCINGSFSLQVSLFAGVNELSASVFDDLEQTGPASNVVSVTYTDTSFKAFGALITLTSSYGRRSSATGAPLDWPLQLTGGAGPYAFSLDWGDGTNAELKSQSLSGVVTINHTFKKAGIYQVNVKVADANGVSAFLQVIAVASGKVDAATTNGVDTAKDTTNRTVILWIPAAIALILLLPTFWLGRRSQIVSLHNKMLKERDAYKQD